MNRKTGTPQEQLKSDAQQPTSDEQQLKSNEQELKPDEQPKSYDQPQANGQAKPDETPPPKPKFIFDPRYCVDLTEKEAGRGFAIVGARDPRRRKKSE